MEIVVMVLAVNLAVVIWVAFLDRRHPSSSGHADQADGDQQAPT